MVHWNTNAGPGDTNIHRRRSLRLMLGGGFVALGIGPALAGPNEAEDASDYFPAWFKQSFMDLRADLAEAGVAGKQGIMLLFHIHGCPYCKRFVERSLKDPVIEAHLRQHFDVIALDIHSQAVLKDTRGQTLTTRGFAAREGMSFSPSVAFYGIAGHTLTRVVGYQSPERFRVTLNQALSANMQSRVGSP